MKTKLLSSINAVAIGLVLLCLIAVPARSNIITVTNTNDSGAGSLRQALADANDGDTIQFAVTGVITLTTGQLMVQNSITISGPGPDNLAVDGNAASRIFYVGPGVTATASGLTVRNGNADLDSGGGIFNDLSMLIVNNCRVIGNAASFDGGGAYNNGVFGSAALTINRSTFSGNSAGNNFTGSGGGVYNNGISGNATVSVYDSTFSNNSTSGGDGGGIVSFGSGFGSSAALVVSNSTFSGNSSIVVGGAIYNDGQSGSATLTISNSTLAGNFADAAGDSIYDEGENGSAPVTLINTIFKARVIQGIFLTTAA